ncbi:MAG: PAS domain S-box protein [Anaerolineae bacterium]|nr:PAS domain S-box protein [Anaerolineae bacterium]
MATTPLSVLVVEDSENDTQLLIRELRRGGFAPSFARVETVDALHAVLDSQSWDVVLADYSLPQLDAMAALRIIQARELDIPFIVVSGAVGEETAVSLMLAGAHDCIIKNNLARLAHAIRRELDQAQERAARRRADRELRESEQRFRLLTQHSPDTFYVIDLTQGRATYCNRDEFLGFSQVEFATREVNLDRIHDDDRPAAMQHWQAFLAGDLGPSAAIEYRILSKADTWEWIQSRETIMAYDDAGHPNEVLITMTVMTERKRAEQSLAQRTRALHALHEVALDLGGELELSALLPHIMAQAANLLDADQGGGIWLYHPTENILCLEAAEGVVAHLVGASLFPDRGIAGWVFQHKQSRIIDRYDDWEGQIPDWVEMLSSNTLLVVPLMWRERVIGVLGVLADPNRRTFGSDDVQLAEMLAAQASLTITNARLRGQLHQQTITLTEEVLQQNVEIRHHEQQAQAILHNIDDAIMLMNTDGIVTYVNRAFTTLLGYQPEDITGQRHMEALGQGLVPHDLRQKSHLVRQQQPWHGEAVLRRKDGTTCEVEMAIVPVPGPNGTAGSMVGSIRDIGRFKQLDRMKTRFMQLISHQLRTPLSSVQLYAELLKTNPPPDKLNSYVGVLDAEIKRLSGLIQKVIDLVRLTDPDAARDRSLVSIPSLFDQTLTHFHTQAIQMGVELYAVPLPDDLPPVRGEQSLLVRALRELVENAIRFSPPGGMVTLAARWLPGTGVALVVSDNGEGINADELAHILSDTFYRGKIGETGHIPGMGLGLAIARVIADQHGGRLVAVSVEQGTEFELVLPVG